MASSAFWTRLWMTWRSCGPSPTISGSPGASSACSRPASCAPPYRPSTSTTSALTSIESKLDAGNRA
jgi:hypothetical protein